MNPKNENNNNRQPSNTFRGEMKARQLLKPKEPIPKLKRNEIGVKSTLQGPGIKRLIDRVISDIVYYNFKNVVLKARGKGTTKLLSIVDILKSKILGLYHYTKTYSTTYVSEVEGEVRLYLI